MKSYSDDIPNIGTEEFKRSARVTEETNVQVKGLTALLVQEHEKEFKNFKNIKTHLWWNTVLLVVSVISSAGTIFFVAKSLIG